MPLWQDSLIPSNGSFSSYLAGNGYGAGPSIVNMSNGYGPGPSIVNMSNGYGAGPSIVNMSGYGVMSSYCYNVIATGLVNITIIIHVVS